MTKASRVMLSAHLLFLKENQPSRASTPRDWLQVEMLTAVDCDPVPLLLTLEGPTLMVFDETLPVEVDG